MNDELEKLCETLVESGITINLRRFGKGWKCWLHCRECLPSGEGATALEAVNAACDKRLEILMMDGN